MKIVENPSKVALQKLQEVLEKENPEGIVDIWVSFCPFYLAAEYAKSIVGVASISLGDDDAAEIYKIYVAPSHRRRGFARMLFKEALQRFRQRGVKEVFFETASDAGYLWLQSVTLGMHVDHYYGSKYSVRLDC